MAQITTRPCRWSGRNAVMEVSCVGGECLWATCRVLMSCLLIMSMQCTPKVPPASLVLVSRRGEEANSPHVRVRVSFFNFRSVCARSVATA